MYTSRAYDDSVIMYIYDIINHSYTYVNAFRKKKPHELQGSGSKIRDDF